MFRFGVSVSFRFCFTVWFGVFFICVVLLVLRLLCWCDLLLVLLVVVWIVSLLVFC